MEKKPPGKKCLNGPFVNHDGKFAGIVVSKILFRISYRAYWYSRLNTHKNAANKHPAKKPVTLYIVEEGLFTANGAVGLSNTEIMGVNF